MSGVHDIIYVAVIDDDESICRSLSRLLRAADMQAITYPSAEAFLADAKQPQFDCLLLDIQLDGMSGIELRRHLVKSGSTLPVIFITAHDDPEAQAQAMQLECVGFFRKTTFGSQIIEAIRNLVQRSKVPHAGAG